MFDIKRQIRIKFKITVKIIKYKKKVKLPRLTFNYINNLIKHDNHTYHANYIHNEEINNKMMNYYSEYHANFYKEYIQNYYSEYHTNFYK